MDAPEKLSLPGQPNHFAPDQGTTVPVRREWFCWTGRL